ncbi:MAG: hypothetical protein ACRDRI_21345 [Pseudonocardiaceae bacterium]
MTTVVHTALMRVDVITAVHAAYAGFLPLAWASLRAQSHRDWTGLVQVDGPGAEVRDALSRCGASVRRFSCAEVFSRDLLPAPAGYDAPVSARHASGVDAVPRARVMALVLIGVGSMGMGWLLWPQVGVVRAARAAVVQSVVCGSSDARDVVRVTLPGQRAVPARLDGCGHRPGEVLAVEVPDPLPEGELVARLPGTGASTATAGGRRLDAVGVTVAGLAGSLLAWRLRGDRGAARRRVGP